jgi:hypothetical protein
MWNEESSEPVLQVPVAFAGLEEAAIIRQRELERHWFVCHLITPNLAPSS